MKKLAILLLAAAFIVAMYVPVSAADWDLYGSARVQTFWTNNSEEAVSPVFDDDVTELSHILRTNARIGANVDAGNIGGRFEYGASGGNANVRLLYGTVDLGAGELEVGKDYSPYSWAGLGVSTQVYGSAADSIFVYNVAYIGRNGMVQYQIDNFRAALVTPTEADNYEGEIQLPRLEAYYSIPMEGMQIGISGLYQTYDLDDGRESGGGDTLNAYGIGAKFLFNQLDPVYFNLAGTYAINPGNFGQSGLVSRSADLSGGVNDVENTSFWNAAAVAGITLANDIRLEAGVGYNVSSNDNWDEDDEAMSYYAQANIPLDDSGNALIVPEIGCLDYKENSDGDDLGDTTYAGLKWQINF